MSLSDGPPTVVWGRPPRGQTSRLSTEKLPCETRDTGALDMDAEQRSALRISLASKREEPQARSEPSDPLADGLLAGLKCGILTTLLGAGGVHLLQRQSFWRRAVTPAGNVWFVTAAGMAGFFVASEKAVLSGTKPSTAPRSPSAEAIRMGQIEQQDPMRGCDVCGNDRQHVK